MARSSKLDIMDEMANQIRDAIVGVLDDDEAIQVEPRMVVNPTPIMASIDIYPASPGRGDESAAFGDPGGEYLFTVRARTTAADDVESQNVLLQLSDDANDMSVPVALLDEPTLNGTATSVHIVDETGFQIFPPGNLVGLTWTVLVVPVNS